MACVWSRPAMAGTLDLVPRAHLETRDDKPARRGA